MDGLIRPAEPLGLVAQQSRCQRTSQETALNNTPDFGPRAAITIPEFCKRWGIGRTKAYELIAQGRLKWVKLGEGPPRITVEAERKFAASLQQANRAA